MDFMAIYGEAGMIGVVGVMFVYLVISMSKKSESQQESLRNLEEAMVTADIKIGDLLGKHIVEETLQREQLEEKVNFYEKEFNINPLSWGRKKK